MKRILLFGAGKSATVLIEYLMRQAGLENWMVIIADQDEELIRSKIGNSPFAEGVVLDIAQGEKRASLISTADVVISLLPPALHFLVAQDCLLFGKHLLTASYVDDRIRSLQQEVENKNILFLCEMGLDPGIDHMSAMELVHRIKEKGGKITSFKSHCGGLVAPESDDNPWHYKISWNPRNIILAGKDGAVYLEHGHTRELNYHELFSERRLISVDDQVFAWYANRDSLNYIPIYNLENAETFIRTTLRHPDFISGWENLVDMKLTDTNSIYFFEADTSLSTFFKLHLQQHKLYGWLKKKLSGRYERAKEMQERLKNILDKTFENSIAGNGEGEEDKESQDQDPIDTSIGNKTETKEVKDARKVREANLLIQQLLYLGLDDEETVIPQGRYSAADVLQLVIEKKLALKEKDRDMVVMIHEIEYELNGEQRALKSSMIVKGKDNLNTAMAKTVGLPLGIAARLILNGQITARGLQIPTLPSIYQSVLKELANEGIVFREQGS